MQKSFGRILVLAEQARKFVAGQPAGRVQSKLLRELEEGIERIPKLAALQQRGIEQERTAAARKNEAREAMERELLPLLIAVGRRVAEERPSLAGHFKSLPKGGDQAFADRVSAMLVTAATERRRLRLAGLDGAVLKGLEGRLKEFGAAATAMEQGRRGHMEASAALEVTAAGLFATLRALDMVQRHRFCDRPGMLAAWKRARTLSPKPASAAAGPGLEQSA